VPDISAQHTFLLKLSDREYRLVAKAIAAFAGVRAARPTPEEVAAAKLLNLELLKQRKAMLTEQLRMADGALGRAEEAGPVPADEEPVDDGSR